MSLRACLLAILVGACAGQPTREQNEAWAKRTFEVARIREVDAAFAARGRPLVDGFPGSLADDGFWPGDRLLFGIESFDFTSVQRFYLLFECVGAAARRGEVVLETHDRVGNVTRRAKVTTDFSPVKVTLLDERLQELRCATSDVAREVHEIGNVPLRPREPSSSEFAAHAGHGKHTEEPDRHFVVRLLGVARGVQPAR